MVDQHKPAVAILRQLGEVEKDQKYTRLVELFADDAVYYDPLLGAQRGKEQIYSFMRHMEKIVPLANVRFHNWTVEADVNCGWATWTMIVTTPRGEIPVRGQSLYRLRDGKIVFVADYLDAKSYGKLRGPDAMLDHLTPAGLSREFAPDSATSQPANDLVRRFWKIQDSGNYTLLSALFTDDAVFTDITYGEMHGGPAIAAYMKKMKEEMPAMGITFELVDCAGDATVAWSQWLCHLPTGSIPGWTLHKVRDGEFTLDADYFDTAARNRLTSTER